MFKSLVPFLLFAFLFTSQAQAEIVMLSLGVDEIAFKDVDGSSGFKATSLISAGFKYSDFWFLFEKGSYSQSTGSGNLEVDLHQDTYLLTTQWEMTQSWGFAVPYAILSAGELNSIVTTNFGNATAKNSDARLLVSAGLGLRTNFKYVFFAAEVQAISTDNYDPNPTVGVTAKIGLYF